jgi:hypothetical protein
VSDSEILGALGVDVAAARASRRSVACACLDWSERRNHLAGSLGAALAEGVVEAVLARSRIAAGEVEYEPSPNLRVPTALLVDVKSL